MAEFNLLPQELVPKSTYVKFTKTLQKVEYFGVFIFILLVAASIVSFFLINRKLQEALVRQERIASSIKTLSNTEQRVFLVKDRVRKSSMILAEQDSQSGLLVVESLVNIVPDGVILSSISIKEGVVIVGLDAVNSSSLVRFLADVIASSEFSRVDLLTMNFLPSKGYGLSLELTK